MKTLKGFPFDRMAKFYTLDQINEAMHDFKTCKTVKPILRIQQS